jgi:Ricin-type beta-trefoil lectin domain-like
MRYRILAIFGALTAILSLSAPAASGSSNLSSANPVPMALCDPCYFWANDNTSVGITYPGIGNQATVTTSPGNSTVMELSSGYVMIQNNNGNCLRMRDANNGYAVMEEEGCNSGDNNELFSTGYDIQGNYVYWVFQNVATGRYLGVACGVQNGWKLWGESGASGTCYRWLEVI